jgi:polysaccharide chain length determinant protein (PEP-CTERM system associated)
MTSTEIASSTSHTKKTHAGFAGLEFYRLRDVQQVLVSRKWMIVAVTLTIGILVSIFAYFLPNQYQASAVIMVDPGKVPENYVKSTASLDAAQRLALLQEQILSDTQLAHVIDQLGIFKGSIGKTPLSSLAAAMRAKIDVTATTGKPPARELRTFTVSFTAPTAIVAAKVSNRLASMFIEQNLKVREQQVAGTADFFEMQLQKAKQDLDQKAQHLAQLRAQYANELPESQNLHLQALTSAQLAAREEADAASRAEQQKVYLQSLLASTPKVINLDSTTSAAHNSLQQQLERLQAELDQLRSHYGPSYPDVLGKEAEIKSVKDSMKELPTRDTVAPATDGPAHNPAVESEISQLDDEIKKHETREARLASQIKFHEAALQRVPAAQEQLTAATNDLSAAADRYKRLGERKFGADMFSDVEARQAGERLVLLDPAQLPEKPMSPNRLLIDAAGAVAGLALALFLVVALEIASPTVKTEREISETLGVPIMGEIPRSTTTVNNRRERFWGLLAASGNLLLALGYFGVLAVSLRK